MSRALLLALLALLLAACSSVPQPRPERVEREDGQRDPQTAAQPGMPPAADCVPFRVHDETLYTAGGLYAPGVPDRAPPRPVDVADLVEPIPRSEPRSRFGNGPTYTVLGRTYRVMDRVDGYVERGIASWYGYKFHGRPTSNREIFDLCAFTAAHRTLPLPSYVRVTNLDNGLDVVVRVNDRGPFHADRLIDLSYAAAARIDMVRSGLARVEVRALKGPAETFHAAAPPAVPGPEHGPQVVQIGAFGDRRNARRLVDQLERAGLPGARLDHVVVDGRGIWRVRFPALAAAAAKLLAERIAATGLATPRLFSPEP